MTSPATSASWPPTWTGAATPTRGSSGRPPVPSSTSTRPPTGVQVAGSPSRQAAANGVVSGAAADSAGDGRSWPVQASSPCNVLLGRPGRADARPGQTHTQGPPMAEQQEPEKQPEKLTATAAADIAVRHGLGIGDAAALRALTEDPDEAEQIAARFVPTESLAAIAARIERNPL